MPDSQLIVRVLTEGATLAAILIVIAFLLSRFTKGDAGRTLLVIFLFVAAGAYFGFAVMARDILRVSPAWTLVEMLQVVVFGVMALRGWRGSPWWLAAGWALHPVWDFALHYVGPGRAFAPWAYAIACISFDLLVAAYVAAVYGLRWGRRLGIRGPSA